MLPGDVLDKDEESLRRKAGRLLFIGLPVTELDRYWRELLREVRPGGVILFGRNIESAEQVVHLTSQIRDAAGRSVFIGVDQEGGLVDRFRDITEPAPSAKSVRNAASAELAERFGSLSARVLRLLGFNINFAPVLDLGGGNEDNGLRGRTFGETPRWSRCSRAHTSTGCRRGKSSGAANTFPASAARPSIRTAACPSSSTRGTRFFRKTSPRSWT